MREAAPRRLAPEVDDWVGCWEDPLPVEEARTWATSPDCGAVVVFVGTVRDWSEGRPGVTSIDYEAYESQVSERLSQLCGATRRRWPDVGRLVLLHRTGNLKPTEASVLVVASSPHRAEAFSAARFCIDKMKSSLPVWKKEHWGDNASDWVADSCPVSEVPEVM